MIRTNLERVMYDSDEMELDLIKKLLSDMIVQKQRWIGTHHPDSKIRKEAFRASGLEIGNNVSLSIGMVVLDSYRIRPIVTIGNRAALGNYVSLIGGSSPDNSLLKYYSYVRENCIKEAPIFIGDDVWIGTGSIILPGITIGEKSIIGAGSVVNKNIPSYSVVAGVPIKVIKKINQNETNL